MGNPSTCEYMYVTQSLYQQKVGIPSTLHQEKHLPAPSSSLGRLILSKQVPGDQIVVLTKFNIASEK